MTDQEPWPRREVTDEYSPITMNSLARLDLASKAHDLADSARGFVPMYGRVGPEAVEDVARLMATAKSLMAAVIVAARVDGTTWEEIGESLGVTKQTAHQRYAAEEDQWRDRLANPTGVNHDGRRYDRRSWPVSEPVRCAAMLDDWVLRHREPGDYRRDDEVLPVTDILERDGPLAELIHLDGQISDLYNDHIVPPPDIRADICDRQAVLYARLADQGVRPAENRAAAAKAQDRAAWLRDPTRRPPVGQVLTPEESAGLTNAEKSHRYGGTVVSVRGADGSDPTTDTPKERS